MFKIGDKVYLRDDSEFNDGLKCNPLNVLGSVVKLTPEDILDYEVEWENGTVNSYNAEDLQLVSTLFVEQQDPLVTIKQSEYDNLVEEVNMLQELVKELSAPQPVDTAQEQQAWTYRELQKLLRNHPSFQSNDSDCTTHAEELIATVKVLQSAYDRLASTPAKQEVITSEFKPISEYTLADWELACKEDWVFECRNGKIIRIMETYINGEYVVRGDDDLTRAIDGRWFVGDTDDDDIVKRVK